LPGPKELLGRFLPPAPATILDIGGGPRVYAAWLADEGYQVHLIDALPHHVEQAAAPRRTSRMSEARCPISSVSDDPSESVRASAPSSRPDLLTANGRTRKPLGLCPVLLGLRTSVQQL
jgi:hypothetical protein